MATDVIPVKENTVSKLQNAVCFAIQVDGAVEKYGVDNKFVRVQVFSKEQDIQ